MLAQMRTYQSRLAVDDDATLRAYAAVFSRALRCLHASRNSGNVLTNRAFGIISIGLEFSLGVSMKEHRPTSGGIDHEISFDRRYGLRKMMTCKASAVRLDGKKGAGPSKIGDRSAPQSNVAPRRFFKLA
jgi:hypothetical protein